MHRILYTLVFLLVLVSNLFAVPTELWRVHLGKEMSVEKWTACQQRGVEIVDYLGEGDYLIRIPQALSHQKVTQITRSEVSRPPTPFQPEEKIAPTLAARLQRDTSRLSLRVVTLPRSETSSMRSSLLALGGEWLGYDPITSTLRCTISVQNLHRLAELSWVLWIHPAPRPRRALDQTSGLQSGVPLLDAQALGGRYHLTGKGVRIGIWDESLDPHPDLQGRYTQEEHHLVSNGHGTHVAGILLGGGYGNRTARGIAPAAHAWCYNFRVSAEDTERDDWEEMAAAHIAHRISLTNNSYGVSYEEKTCSDYQEMVYDLDAPYDQVAAHYPFMTHVFAVGNERALKVCQGKFRNGGYASSPSRGKNLLYVGAIDADQSMPRFSSWGPTDDGRLLPTVVAHGVQVLSTNKEAGYIPYSGTSMSTPAATGVLALATEYYAEQHGGDVPRSDLLRALAANCADDLFAAGPDYTSGYGLVNAPAMITTLEQGWYHFGRAEAQGQTSEHTLVVPEGTTRVRVMLVWNDAVSLRPHVWGARALINDLDLRVTSSEGATLPWILDASHPTAVATRGTDRFNNIEQVTLDNPTGVLKIEVLAHELPKPAQDWVLVWYFERESPPKFLVPSKEGTVGSLFPVFTEGFVPPLRLEVLQGESKVSEQSLSTPGTLLRLPETLQGSFHLRARDTKGHSVLSPQLQILPIPKGITLKATPTQIQLSWDAVQGIAEPFHYSVKMSCGAQDAWQEVAQVSTETKCTLPLDKLFGATEVAFAVNVVTTKGEGGLSETVLSPALPYLQETSLQFENTPEVEIIPEIEGQKLTSGARLPRGTQLHLRVQTLQGKALERLSVNGVSIDFRRQNAGQYTAQFTIPYSGLFPVFHITATTLAIERPQVILHSLRSEKGDYSVLWGSDTLQDGTLLLGGTWLRLHHPIQGRFLPTHFLVNGHPLMGIQEKGALVALYRLPADYSEPTLTVSCAYEALPTRRLHCTLAGGEATWECESNGAPVGADSLCVQGAELRIMVRLADNYVLDKLICDGRSLQVFQKDGIFVGLYTVPTGSTLPVRIEFRLRALRTHADDLVDWSTVCVSPNPFTTRIQIKSLGLEGSYTLLSPLGVVLSEGVWGVGDTELSTTNLPSGVYLLQLRSGTSHRYCTLYRQ